MKLSGGYDFYDNSVRSMLRFNTFYGGWLIEY